MKQKTTILSSLIFLCMLPLPALALLRIIPSIKLIYVGGYLTLISAITLLAYRSDKRKAESNQWRIPEAHLHFYELLGGWGTAFWAQRIFHHKTSKKGYQFVYWLIVLIHQCAAFDYVQHGKFSAAAFHAIESLLK